MFNRISIVFAVTGILLQPVTAYAVDTSAIDTSANLGFSSHYIFRGVPQEKSSAFGGLDLESSGFYLGTWVAEVAPGLEADLYGGYAGEVGDFTYGIGFTGYFYTDDFDDTYLELNLSGGWRFFTLDVAVGEYENFSGPTLDYTFVSGTVEYNGFYGVFGSFSQDMDGEYIEFGYGNTLTVGDTELLDYTLSIIRSSDELSGNTIAGQPDEDTFFNFSITKGFSL